MARLLSDGNISETAIQKAIIKWVRIYSKISPFIFHLPNEGKRTEYYGKMLKDMGMRPGVADLLIAMPKHGYCGAWIELKSKNGKLSSEQAAFLEDMESQNYFTKVCRSIEEGIDTIMWYTGVSR